MAKTPLVINTFSFIWRQRVEDCLSHLAERGYERFEILLSEPHCWPASLGPERRQHVARLLRERELEIVALNPGGFDNNLASPAADVRGFAVAYLKASMELAEAWGIRDLVVSPGMGRPLLRPPRERLLPWLGASLERLLPAAERTGTRLLLENVPFSFLPGVDDLIRVVERINDPHLKIVYDAANAVFIGEDPVAGLLRALPHLGLLHLSDTSRDVWRHDQVGLGVVPFAEIGRAVADTGFAQPVVLEVIAEQDPERAIAASAAKLRELGWAA